MKERTQERLFATAEEQTEALKSAAEYVGCDSDTFVAACAVAGWTARITKVNGIPALCTLDYRTDRINYHVAGGKVVRLTGLADMDKHREAESLNRAAIKWLVQNGKQPSRTADEFWRWTQTDLGYPADDNCLPKEVFDRLVSRTRWRWVFITKHEANLAAQAAVASAMKDGFKL